MHPLLNRLRRAAVARGLLPVDVSPPPHDSRLEEISAHPARVVEDPGLAIHPVGDPEPWREPVAFLDGTQRYRIFAYGGCSPVAWVELGAAVRVRRARRFSTAVHLRRQFIAGRREVLDLLAGASDGLSQACIPDDVPRHPHRELQAIRRLVDTARGRLEQAAGTAWREKSDQWLLVDGSLGVTPAWAADPKMLGIVKSHAALPFEGDDLVRYLRLPAAHRTSVFAPAPSVVAPVYSWALRLWDPGGRDVFHGLIRVECAPRARSVAEAGELARRLLAERAPLSTPDARWDRLLYGFRDVEIFLRAGTGQQESGTRNEAPGAAAAWEDPDSRFLVPGSSKGAV